jgi:hypothetical protein
MIIICLFFADGKTEAGTDPGYADPGYAARSMLLPVRMIHRQSWLPMIRRIPVQGRIRG